jgi:hypothetical protein
MSAIFKPGAREIRMNRKNDVVRDVVQAVECVAQAGERRDRGADVGEREATGAA